MIVITTIETSMERSRMNVDSNQFRGSPRTQLDEAKREISRFFDKELSLLAEERRDRAERLGIDDALHTLHGSRPA